MYFGDLEQNVKDKLLIVDDNPQVHGLYMPMIQSKIVPIEEAGLKESDLVILLLNAAYHEKVLSKIHKTNPGISVYCLNEFGLSAKSL